MDETENSSAFENIGQWRRRLECVVQQQGGHIEHYVKPAGCDSYFRQ